MMSQTEFSAMIELLGWLFFDRRTGMQILLLVLAAVLDYQTRRIPNWLVVSGALYGAIYNTLLPPTPHDNFLFPLMGLALGLVLFLPLYLMRAMGAGDVKLMAMVGAFLGPADTLYAALFTMVSGGVLAILLTLMRGTALAMLKNIAMYFQISLVGVANRAAPSLQNVPRASVGKLPYGVAIAIGTIGYLVLHQLSFI